jgi:RHS repeat-associated protein
VTDVLALNPTAASPMFNGNIAAMAMNNPAVGGNVPLVYNYHYDQLNRMVQMDAFKGWSPVNNTFTPVQIPDYQERVSYDPNGNIGTYVRHGYGSNIPMDSLTYNYYSSTNQLAQIVDGAASTYTTDLKTQASPTNYTYDLIGELKRDSTNGVSNVDWTNYGKIKDLTNASGAITYTYDAATKRITKSAGVDSTVYVRDAQGDVLAIYQKVGTGVLQLIETDLYGSSRIGSVGPLTVSPATVALTGGFGNATLSTFTRGEKSYELSNHLGNVLLTITDKKIAVVSGSNSSLIDHFTADVATAQDYYPFGMQMPGRTFTASTATSYRYGYNGKEKNDEIEGVGNAYDYGMREHDPRTGRFWSVDPLTQKYPWYSPYQFAGDKPTWATDLDGLEENTTSTYVYHPPVIFKPAFKGIISITDATDQAAHKVFEGNFGQLAKADPSKYSLGIVNALVGDNIGSSTSRLDVTMTGTRSEVSKTWKGTDINYFTQYSYSFTSNNVTENGTFELQNGTVKASARAWDPLMPILFNKIVQSVIAAGVLTPYERALQSTSAEALQASKNVFNGTTLYRLGTTGMSKTGADAQFWSLENPLAMGLEEYAKKYGIPLKNLEKANFLETATLKQGASYITREAPIAPGAPAGSGGGIEAVVEQGGTTGNVIIPIQH